MVVFPPDNGTEKLNRKYSVLYSTSRRSLLYLYCTHPGLRTPVPMDAVIGGVNATPEKPVPGTQSGSVVSREAVLVRY